MDGTISGTESLILVAILRSATRSYTTPARKVTALRLTWCVIFVDYGMSYSFLTSFTIHATADKGMCALYSTSNTIFCKFGTVKAVSNAFSGAAPVYSSLA